MLPLNILPDYCYPNSTPAPGTGYQAPACAAPVLPPPPPDAMPVINVRDFLVDALCGFEPGHTPTEAERNLEAIRRAAEAVPDSGGILYFPAGTYSVAGNSCRPIAIKSNTWVRGAGRSSVLHQATPGVCLLWVYGVENVRISDLGFDLDHGECTGPGTSRNFSTGIAIGEGLDAETGTVLRARNIVVERCELWTSDPPTRGQTLMGILAQGVDGLWVQDNRLRGLQIKAAGGGGSTRVFIQRNHISDPYNLAISLVVDAVNGTVTDALIADNVVENLPSAGGIFVGTDGEGTHGDLCSGIVVRNNVIRGAWSGVSSVDYNCDGRIRTMGASVGMIFDVPPRAFDWIISGNVVENTTHPTPDHTLGISVNASTATAVVRSLIITGNTVRNVDLAGIRVTCAVEGLVVSDNHIEDARGIAVQPTAAGISDGIISGNTCVGWVSGIDVDTVTGDVRGLRITGNALVNRVVAGQVHWMAVRLQSHPGRTLSADVVGNRCEARGAFGYRAWGIVEEPHSPMPHGVFAGMRYLDNDLESNVPDRRYTPLELREPTAVVRGNCGVRREARGVAAIAAGLRHVDVPHGLGHAPRVEDVRITAVEFPASWESGLVWASLPDAAHVRVHCAVAPRVIDGESLVFAWQVTAP